MISFLGKLLIAYELRKKQNSEKMNKVIVTLTCLISLIIISEANEIRSTRLSELDEDIPLDDAISGEIDDFAYLNTYRPIQQRFSNHGLNRFGRLKRVGRYGTIDDDPIDREVNFNNELAPNQNLEALAATGRTSRGRGKGNSNNCNNSSFNHGSCIIN